MFRLTQNTPGRGDATAGYEVTLDREYTVQEFIDAILQNKSNDWGYIGIEAPGTFFGSPNCQYKYGSVVTEQLPADILSRKIKKAKADGGWSRMDYLFELTA